MKAIPIRNFISIAKENVSKLEDMAKDDPSLLIDKNDLGNYRVLNSDGEYLGYVAFHEEP